MPAALAITRSSGVVMKPRTRSALAPTNAVVTLTTAMSLRGYCRTLSARIACTPAIRITRLTTIARTGRLTNRSVNRILAFLRLGSRLVLRLNFIVDDNGSAVPKLEGARRHDLFFGFDAGQHGNLIASRRTELHKLLAYAAIGSAFRIFEIFNDV